MSTRSRQLTGVDETVDRLSSSKEKVLREYMMMNAPESIDHMRVMAKKWAAKNGENVKVVGDVVEKWKGWLMAQNEPPRYRRKVRPDPGPRPLP